MKFLAAAAICSSILSATASPLLPIRSPYGVFRRSSDVVVYNFDTPPQDDFLKYTSDVKIVNPLAGNASATYAGLNATSLPNVGFVENGVAFFSARNSTTFSLLSVVIKARGINKAVIQGFKPGNSTYQAEASFVIGGPDDRQQASNVTTYADFKGLDAFVVQVYDEDMDESVPFTLDDIMVIRSNATNANSTNTR